MANTITAFNTFAPNTTIRSAQVNTNFSNFRGDFVPINSDTASASDNTHDLGTSDHQWKDLYLGGNLIIGGVTSTSVYIKNVTGTVSNPVSVDDTTTIIWPGGDETIMFLQRLTGAAGDITTGTDQISDGSVAGQRLTLIGCDNSLTVALQDGDNLNLNGGITLYKFTALDLIWDSTAIGWIETSRRN